jgi:hypothetical protein
MGQQRWGILKNLFCRLSACLDTLVDWSYLGIAGLDVCSWPFSTFGISLAIISIGAATPSIAAESDNHSSGETTQSGPAPWPCYKRFQTRYKVYNQL